MTLTYMYVGEGYILIQNYKSQVRRTSAKGWSASGWK